MKQSFKDLAQRRENARERFIDVMIEQYQFTKEQAQQILKTYLKLKLVKLSPNDGQFNIKHGAYMDKAVLKRALIVG